MSPKVQKIITKPRCNRRSSFFKKKMAACATLMEDIVKSDPKKNILDVQLAPLNFNLRMDSPGPSLRSKTKSKPENTFISTPHHNKFKGTFNPPFSPIINETRTSKSNIPVRCKLKTLNSNLPTGTGSLDDSKICLVHQEKGDIDNNEDDDEGDDGDDDDDTLQNTKSVRETATLSTTLIRPEPKQETPIQTLPTKYMTQNIRKSRTKRFSKFANRMFQVANGPTEFTMDSVMTSDIYNTSSSTDCVPFKDNKPVLNKSEGKRSKSLNLPEIIEKLKTRDQTEQSESANLKRNSIHAISAGPSIFKPSSIKKGKQKLSRASNTSTLANSKPRANIFDSLDEGPYIPNFSSFEEDVEAIPLGNLPWRLDGVQSSDRSDSPKLNFIRSESDMARWHTTKPTLGDCSTNDEESSGVPTERLSTRSRTLRSYADKREKTTHVGIQTDCVLSGLPDSSAVANDAESNSKRTRDKEKSVSSPNSKNRSTKNCLEESAAAIGSSRENEPKNVQAETPTHREHGASPSKVLVTVSAKKRRKKRQPLELPKKKTETASKAILANSTAANGDRVGENSTSYLNFTRTTDKGDSSEQSVRSSHYENRNPRNVHGESADKIECTCESASEEVQANSPDIGPFNTLNLTNCDATIHNLAPTHRGREASFRSPREFTPTQTEMNEFSSDTSNAKDSILFPNKTVTLTKKRRKRRQCLELPKKKVTAKKELVYANDDRVGESSNSNRNSKRPTEQGDTQDRSSLHSKNRSAKNIREESADGRGYTTENVSKDVQADSPRHSPCNNHISKTLTNGAADNDNRVGVSSKSNGNSKFTDKGDSEVRASWSSHTENKSARNVLKEVAVERRCTIENDLEDVQADSPDTFNNDISRTLTNGDAAIDNLAPTHREREASVSPKEVAPKQPEHNKSSQDASQSNGSVPNKTGTTTKKRRRKRPYLELPSKKKVTSSKGASTAKKNVNVNSGSTIQGSGDSQMPPPSTVIVKKRGRPRKDVVAHTDRESGILTLPTSPSIGEEQEETVRNNIVDKGNVSVATYQDTSTVRTLPDTTTGRSSEATTSNYYNLESITQEDGRPKRVRKPIVDRYERLLALQNKRRTSKKTRDDAVHERDVVSSLASGIQRMECGSSGKSVTCRKVPTNKEFKKLNEYFDYYEEQTETPGFTAGYYRLYIREFQKLQTSPDSDYVFVVLDGKADLKVNERVFQLARSTQFRIPADAEHMIRNGNTRKKCLLHFTKVKHGLE